MMKMIIIKSKTNVSYAIKEIVMIMIVKILKIIEKFVIIVITLVNIEMQLTVLVIYGIKPLKKIPVVFYNGSKYDYHLIIKELAKGLDYGEFKCLGENTEKYISFLIPIKKEHNDGRIEMFQIQFIDSLRFMPTALSDLADNLSEIYKKSVVAVKR